MYARAFAQNHCELPVHGAQLRHQLLTIGDGESRREMRSETFEVPNR
jgi:hypothetical protein